MTEDELLTTHLDLTGRVADAALARLKAAQRTSWENVMRALAAGGMLRISSSASLAGFVHIALDLVLPDGRSVSVMSAAIEGEAPTTLN
jgi:hypothetical protein